MTVLTDASEVLSRGALPSTVIVSVLLPTVSAKSSRARWSTSTTTPFWWTVLKPFASTVMLYGPGSKAGTLYSPCPFEETVRVALVSALCTTTRAPATARLDGSLIKPESSGVLREQGRCSQQSRNNPARPKAFANAARE